MPGNSLVRKSQPNDLIDSFTPWRTLRGENDAGLQSNFKDFEQKIDLQGFLACESHRSFATWQHALQYAVPQYIVMK